MAAMLSGGLVGALFCLRSEQRDCSVDFRVWIVTRLPEIFFKKADLDGRGILHMNGFLLVSVLT